MKRLLNRYRRFLLVHKLRSLQEWVEVYRGAELRARQERHRAEEEIAHVKVQLSKLDANEMLDGEPVVVLE